MNSARSNINLRAQMNSEFNEFVSTKSWLNKKSNETKIRLFKIIMREISFFQNQQNFGLKLGKIEEHLELKCKIKALNLIKTQITTW